MQNQKKENQMGNSRVLKFRAWDKERKEFLDYFEVGCRGMIICNEKNEPQNIELMQFTGLKDKNGKEIYEGDIVKLYLPILDKTVYKKIYWDELFSGFMCGEGTLALAVEDGIEIIGNIYESKHLLDNTDTKV